MAIANMTSFTILTHKEYKASLLRQLQKFGKVHFKNLQISDNTELLSLDNSQEKIVHFENEIAKIKYSLQKLAPFDTTPKGLKALSLPPVSMDFKELENFEQKYQYEKIYDSIKDASQTITFMQTEIGKLKSANENLELWKNLDVSTKDLNGLITSKYLLGGISKTLYESFYERFSAFSNEIYLEKITEIKDDIIVLFIFKNENEKEFGDFLRSVSFSKISTTFEDLPTEMIAKNKSEIKICKSEIKEATLVLENLSSEIESMKIMLDTLQTLLTREKTCNNFLKTENTFVISGFTPTNQAQKLEDLIQKNCGQNYFMEKIDIKKNEQNVKEVPVKLINNKLVKTFEPITAMYSTPMYGEIDPTPILTPFYIFFFGIMVADFGYGLLIMLATIFALTKLNLKEGTKTFIKFFFYLSFSIMVAGLIFGSFFGMTFFTPIQMADGTFKPILDTKLDIVFMMVLSLGIGYVSIITGICVKGYMLIRDGKILDAIFDSLLWIIALTSGIGLVLGAANVVNATVSEVFKWGLILSLVGLAITQGREAKSVGAKIGTGLFAVYGITGYLGDLISYTRLVALALSGAYIGYSFNQMVEIIPSGPLRIIFGTLIFVFAHALNLGLAALGAYVHTSRLQYVEFFGKFYEGGGIAFAPLKVQNDFVNIKNN